MLLITIEGAKERLARVGFVERLLLSLRNANASRRCRTASLVALANLASDGNASKTCSMMVHCIRNGSQRARCGGDLVVNALTRCSARTSLTNHAVVFPDIATWCSK